MTASLDASRQWMLRLSRSVTLLNGPLPYVPLFLKDITAYVQLHDYEMNRIKTIQTLGYLRREEEGIKIVDIDIEDVAFPVCLNQLPFNDIYFDVPRNNCNNIWEYNIVRLYGTLEKNEDKITINVIHIFEIKDIRLCEKMFETLSLLTRKGYHQFNTVVVPDDDA